MHYKDEEQTPLIPSDVADTVNEIRDGLNVLFDDSVRRVKGTADRWVAFPLSSAPAYRTDLACVSPKGLRTTTLLLWDEASKTLHRVALSYS